MSVGGFPTNPHDIRPEKSNTRISADGPSGDREPKLKEFANDVFTAQLRNNNDCRLIRCAEIVNSFYKGREKGRVIDAVNDEEDVYRIFHWEKGSATVMWNIFEHNPVKRLRMDGGVDREIESDILLD